MAIEKKRLHFSVYGEFITAQAREKLFVDKDMASALRILRSSTISDKLSSDEQLMLCLQILHGAASITGRSDSPDYGIEFRDDIDERPTNLSSISQLITDMAQEIENLKQENYEMACRIGFLAGRFENWELMDINAEYYNETGGMMFSDMAIPDWKKKENQYMGMDNMVESFLAQRRREEEAQKNDELVSDYGWLEPDGTFHPVEWGEHSGWAGEWLNENMPYRDNPDIYWYTDVQGERHYISNNDVLTYSLGWILLHSPFQGLAQITKDPSRNMTNDQKEFLYDYFNERGRKEDANALYEN